MVIAFGISIYIWNKYIVTNLIKSVNRMNNNKWLSRNEGTIILIYQGFFWTGFGMFILSMVISN